MCCALVCAYACADKQPNSVMVSSAGMPSYAVSYPDRLTAESAQLTTDKQQADEQSQKLAARPSEIKPGADPAVLQAVVRQADEAGRSEAFVRANQEARDLHAFWTEERGPISARVNGAAQKQLSEGNCGACAQTDLSGPISYALGSGVDKQLEKRLRAANEAHNTIEYYKANLGAANVPVVQKLADDIALTSYQVNVALPQDRNRVDGMLAESDDVDSTLERAIEWEHAYQGDKNRSAGDKKDSQERVVVLGKSRAAIPQAVANAQAARKDLDPQIEALRKRYAETLEALQKQIETQAEAQKAQAKK